MGNCCASNKIDPNNQPYYKFCLCKVFPQAIEVSNQRQFNCYNLQAFAGSMPIVINIWSKEAIFENTSQGKKTKRVFYEDSDLIAILFDNSINGVIKGLKSVKSEVDEAQYHHNGIIELPVAIIAINESSDPKQYKKMLDFASNHNWMVIHGKDDTQKTIETELRKLSGRVAKMGVKPKGNDASNPVMEQESDDEFNQVIEDFRKNTNPNKGSIIFGDGNDPILQKQSKKNDQAIRGLVQDKL